MKRIYLSALAGAGCATLAHAQHGHGGHGNIIEEINPRLGVVVDANFYHEDSDGYGFAQLQ